MKREDIILFINNEEYFNYVIMNKGNVVTLGMIIDNLDFFTDEQIEKIYYIVIENLQKN